MALMFTETSSIKKAVGLMNLADASKFPSLLTRIAQNLHVKDVGTFSPEEETKLMDVFQFSANDLELVVHTIEFFLQQAAYYTAKPPVLREQLEKLGLLEDKVEMVVEAWTSNARETLTKLRQRTIAPKQLEAVNWRLNLQLASSHKSKMKNAMATFELVLGGDNDQKKDRVITEFTHSELYDFYQKLETIQSQIDGLS